MGNSIWRKFRDFWLKTPSFPESPEMTRMARAISILSYYLYIAIFLAALGSAFFFAEKTLSLIIVFVLFLLVAIMRALLLKGKPHSGVLLFIIVDWIITTLVIAMSGGIYSTNILLQLSCVLISGVFLGMRWMAGLAIATFIADGAMALYVITGGVMPPIMSAPPISRLFILGISLIVCVAPLQVVINDLKRAIEKLTASRKRYQTLFDQAPVMYVILHDSPEGLRITDCNREFSKTIGQSVENVRGQLIENFYTSSSAEEFKKGNALADPNASLVPVERTLKTADGTQIETLATASSIMDEEDPSISIFKMYLNVSERQRIDRERRRLLKERETLLHELHHRSINNMQIMSSLIAMYEEEEAGEGLTKKYRAMRNRIEAMSLAMRQVYDSSNLASIDLTSYTLDLASFCAGSIPVNHHRASFAYDLTEISSSLDIALPFGLILMELVGNALEHAFPAERSDARVSIRLLRTGRGQVALVVHDNGIGLAPAFDFRRDSGIGLRNALLIAEDQLHGHLRFASTNGLHCHLEFPL